MLDLMGFKDEFISQCRSTLSELGPGDMKIEEQQVNKAQRGLLNGMLFIKDGLNCAPTFYVEDFYNAYKAGSDIKDLSRNAVGAAVSSMGMANMLAGKTEALIKDTDNLVVKLFNESRNKEYMKNLATKDVGCGFFLTANVEFGEYGVSVTKSMLKEMRTSRTKLFGTAINNTMKKYPPMLFDLKDSIFPDHIESENLLESAYIRAPLETGPGYVLTNSRLFWGAGALFYPGVMSRIHELLDDDFYVLPSSVHELIIMAAGDQDPAHLAELVRSANRTVVEPADILADDLYICESCELRRVSYGGVIPEDAGCVC